MEINRAHVKKALDIAGVLFSVICLTIGLDAAAVFHNPSRFGRLTMGVWLSQSILGLSGGSRTARRTLACVGAVSASVNLVWMLISPGANTFAWVMAISWLAQSFLGWYEKE